MLSRLGYEVLTARGGAEALELSRRFPGPIHLLLTDVVMPGMTGRELAERLRATRPDTPALFTSGHASEVEGAEDLLQKPFTAEALALKVAAALRRAATPAALVRD
jgi:two-component system cell cycle sensor histidine kinase/response regulator CckA